MVIDMFNFMVLARLLSSAAIVVGVVAAAWSIYDTREKSVKDYLKRKKCDEKKD